MLPNSLKKLKITVLVENTAGGRGLIGEHGLSFLIEADEQRILFDTGQGLALPHNAKILDISLNNLDAIVLSHGHYDHAGGIPSLLDHCAHTDLFLHPQAIAPKYSNRGNIGFPLANEQTLRSHFRRLIWTETPRSIIPGVYVTGTIPRRHPLENTGGSFWHDRQHSQVDSLLDDQALYLQVPNGLVVILGCAHAGVINTLNYIAQLTNRNKFYAVIGGMHLLQANKKRLQATVEALKNYDVQIVGANHCTGMKALTFLWHELGERCLDCRVGTQLQFGNVKEIVVNYLFS
jgi:7,8-dihydropterin-6-yl-methyl-4-(beta-D-ribofuranosyl)aminobenzene 5'-phosphate synthase